MQLLEEELNVGGFRMRQISRDGDVAVYEQTEPGKESIAYEVIIIRRLPAQTLFGREYPEREGYPPSERWGELGWTFTDRERALEKAREVSVAQLNQKGGAQVPFHRIGAKQGRKSRETAALA